MSIITNNISSMFWWKYYHCLRVTTALYILAPNDVRPIAGILLIAKLNVPFDGFFHFDNFEYRFENKGPLPERNTRSWEMSL